MSDIFDLDDRAEEPEVQPFQFRFGGETFTCQHPEALDVRDIGDIVATADRDPSVMLPVMLPPDELERLEALDDVFTLRHLRLTQEAWMNHYGLSAPKSQPSRKSSKAKRIK